MARALTEGVRDMSKLPKAAIEYLKFISEELGVEIGMISTGPERDATITQAACYRRGDFLCPRAAQG